MKTKKVLLIKNESQNYIVYLMKNLALSICNVNNCQYEEINSEFYKNEYGNIEVPSIVLLKNNKIINIMSGFKYLEKVPKF